MTGRPFLRPTFFRPLLVVGCSSNALPSFVALRRPLKRALHLSFPLLSSSSQGMIFVVAFSSSLDVAAIEIGEDGVL